MYDEWIQHTAAADSNPPRAPTPKLRTPDFLKLQSPRSSLERTRPNVTPKPAPKRTIPVLPTPEVPRRPKSLSDLRIDVEDEPSNSETAEITNGPPTAGELPPRPKSRNDMDILKRSRFGKKQGPTDRRPVKQVHQLKDELDFAEWYGDLEQKLEDANDKEYRLLLATLDSHLMACNNLITTTDDALKVLDDLRDSFQVVESQTSNFQNSCADLLSKHNRLQALSDSVATNLRAFTEREPITRALARPDSEFARPSSFREMLGRLDRFIEWMEVLF
ncbi:hypothetical protein EX30DRAFT_102176 [Ascodesmis nigricans]|uniref:Conserved oligomeric Golgi complex subunit 3 N-terminal domain-containing protein n=1 Tax=Ascodesmis nigricans TaxID=341454 RepID=A0A4V3SJJ5_9PEZI|nr:hypothetical protein EX30DRAFT_102176 [Ascodesmis nigricans]